jgi:hypothetical protein
MAASGRIAADGGLADLVSDQRSSNDDCGSEPVESAL